MAPPQESERVLIAPLQPAAAAFEAIAPSFDSRFGAWRSVAAQRRAVRSVLLREFPTGGSIFEIGGGTGEDAAFLAAHGYRIYMTDPSPAMVSIAGSKLVPLECHTAIVAAEELDEFAARYLSAGGAPFDGAYSNFAALNCVEDLRPVARALARLLRPGARAMLVLFGCLCPCEMLAETLRRRPERAMRRLRSGAVPAHLAGHQFSVVYHRRAQLERAFTPWFSLEKRFGIGITVPPSAAEPWISQHPRLLNFMEHLDRVICGSLALLGDHVLYQFRRTTEN